MHLNISTSLVLHADELSAWDEEKWRKSPRHSHHPEQLGGMGEAQHALHAGHFPRNRGEGETLQERRKEKEQLHSGQVLP